VSGPKVTFAEDAVRDHSEAVTPSAPQRRRMASGGEDGDGRGRSDSFPWLAVLAIVILGCVGAFMAYCSWRRRSRRR
jgi:hypothetical protein